MQTLLTIRNEISALEGVAVDRDLALAAKQAAERARDEAVEARDVAQQEAEAKAAEILVLKARIAELEAGGGDPEPDPDPVIIPPLNLAPPEITGIRRVGEVLDLHVGLWDGTPPLLHVVEWFCDGQPTIDPVLDDSLLLLLPEHGGRQISARLTTSNASGQVVVTDLGPVEIEGIVVPPGQNPENVKLFVAPEQRGAGHGLSPENAASIDRANFMIPEAVQRGGNIGLLTEYGPYNYRGGGIIIDKGGLATAKRILVTGIDLGLRPARAKFIGTRGGGTDPQGGVPRGMTWQPTDDINQAVNTNSPWWGSQGNTLFKLKNGANNLEFANIDAERYQYVFVPEDIESFLLRDFLHRNVSASWQARHGAGHGTKDLIIRDGVIQGHNEECIGVYGDSSNTLIQRVRVNSGYQAGGKFAICFMIDGGIGTLIDECHGEHVLEWNSVDDDGFWNGDIFCSNRGARDLIIRNSSGKSASDCVLDMKSKGVQIIDFLAEGAKTNIKVWDDMTIENFTSVSPRKSALTYNGVALKGGTGNVAHILRIGGNVATVKPRLTVKGYYKVIGGGSPFRNEPHQSAPKVGDSRAWYGESVTMAPGAIIQELAA